jgi:hypothetical protein
MRVKPEFHVFSFRVFSFPTRAGGYAVRVFSFICCRTGADEAMAKMRSMMSKLKLTVNETKTRTCVLPDETFDFLGYTFGRCYNHRTGAAYLAASPAKKKIAKLCDAIGEQTSSRRTQRDEEEMVGRLNRKLRGWVNYFDLGTVGRAYSIELADREEGEDDFDAICVSTKHQGAIVNEAQIAEDDLQDFIGV